MDGYCPSKFSYVLIITMLLNHLLFFAAGLIGLWIGSDLITHAAAAIAKRMGLSETFIGLTVLAIGTDFPEIMVAMTGAVDQLQGADTAGLVVGNVIGSNMGQISLVLGLAGLLKVFKMRKKEVMKNGLMLIVSTFLLLALSLDGMISRLDGLILVSLYLLYFFSIQRTTKISMIKGKVKRFKSQSIVTTLKLIGGSAIIFVASDLVVHHGVEIADVLEISPTIVGAIMIGLGTSLPELAVSVSAVIKGSNGLSIGNLIGSNLIDIAIALGGSAMIGGWRVDRSVATFDMSYLLFTSVVVVLFLLTKETLEKKESILILSLYGVYLSLKLLGF